jgi:hypothetical protein
MEKSTHVGLTHIKDNMVDDFYRLKKHVEKMNLDFMVGHDLDKLLIEIRTLEAFLEAFKPAKVKVDRPWGKCI